MFRWVTRLLERRRLAQRGLFRYHDGARVRYGDPFAIYRTLYNDPVVNLERSMDSVDAGEEPETTQLMELLAKTFDAKRWDGQSGLTDWELLALFGAFTDYLDGLKKNISPGPTWSRPTDSESSVSPAGPEPVTSSCADCG